MENNRISGLLWIVFAVITLSIILYTQLGLWFTTEFAAAGILAFVGWLLVSKRKLPDRSATVPFYILSVTLFLVLNTARFASGYSAFLEHQEHRWFKPDIHINHTSWFLSMVCFPVSAMLGGGYLFVKGKAEGVFFAWWTFFFCLLESLLQFCTELLNLDTYDHQYFSGVLSAIALFLVSAYGIVSLISHSAEHRLIAPYPTPDRRRINLWSVLFVTLVILYGISLYEQAGILPVGVIAGSMMGGMIGWRKTTARFPADPYKLVPLYLLLQALFYVHVGEETLTHFNRGIAAISGHAWQDADFDYLITLIGPVIWMFAAWSLWKGQAFGNFILWFMIVGMILGEPTHVLVFPLIRMYKEGVGYDYFSGMYTALFPMIPAIMAGVIIVRDYRLKPALHA